MSRLLLVIGVAATLGACAGTTVREGFVPPSGSPEPPPPEGSTEADGVAPEELAAFERAKPVFERYCAGCHSAGGDAEAREHFDMSSYPFGGHHADEIGHEIREVLGADGDEPTMPEDDPGVVRGKELDLVLAWSRAFDSARSQSASGEHGAHEGHEHEGHELHEEHQHEGHEHEEHEH